jgi:hypothetical protein
MNLHGLPTRAQMPQSSVPKEQQENQPETKTVDIETQCENPLTQTKNCFRKPPQTPSFTTFSHNGLHNNAQSFCIHRTMVQHTCTIVNNALQSPFNQNNNQTSLKQKRLSLSHNAENHCANPEIVSQKPPLLSVDTQRHHKTARKSKLFIQAQLNHSTATLSR